MAALIKPHLIIFTLSLAITKGFCDCSLNNITIGTVRSGREIQGKTEWNVEVINNCPCAQSHILLACKGFRSAESVDPDIFLRVGELCLLLRGQPLPGKSSVKFSYAWDPPFIMFAQNSEILGC